MRVQHSYDVADTDVQHFHVKKVRAVVLCSRSGGRFEQLLLRTRHSVNS